MILFGEGTTGEREKDSGKERIKQKYGEKWELGWKYGNDKNGKRVQKMGKVEGRELTGDKQRQNTLA